MRIQLILALVIGMLFSFELEAQTHTVGGETFPDKLKIGNETTVYNGAGVRTKFFMKLYVSTFYLPSKSSNAQAIIDQDKTSAVRLKIVSSMVTREKFIETVRSGFAKSTDGKATKKQIDDLMALYTDEFNKGDDIIITYRPKVGIEVYMNSKKLGTVDGGLEFKKALFSIWLGKNPVDETLKNKMLGK